MNKFRKFLGYGAAIIAILAGLYFYVADGSFLKERRDVSFGVSFSTLMARQLGFDLVRSQTPEASADAFVHPVRDLVSNGAGPREVFEAIVDDLGARKIRIPVYWSEVEPEQGKFDFGDYDYFVSKSERAGVKLILAIGRKLPRWPECHIPSWIAWESTKPKTQSTNDDFETAVLNYVKVVVERYKNSSAVEAWQVENEPFHAFGAGCAEGKIKTEYVDREIALVRSLDSRPVMLTDAGKAGTWFTSLRRADILGVTMYYQVWNPRRGIVWSTFGPGLYAVKRKVLELFFPNKKMVVAELQAEPYGPALLPDYDFDLQTRLMNSERFKETIRRARKAGFSENYLWGAEWWYWLGDKQKDWSMWNEAKNLF